MTMYENKLGVLGRVSYAKDHKSVVVERLPQCDICKLKGHSPVADAEYDTKSKLRGASWAFMCEQHFNNYGSGLGIGKGQKLILKEKV